MQDMTMSEVLKDPLIRQMLRADKVSLGAFAQLLESAAANWRPAVGQHAEIRRIHPGASNR